MTFVLDGNLFRVTTIYKKLTQMMLELKYIKRINITSYKFLIVIIPCSQEAIVKKMLYAMLTMSDCLYI